jgi:DNA-binding response OmpR family regulator
MAAKVLIVEDDDASRSGLSQLLEHAGYEVTAAETYEQAQRLLTAVRPDLLITDIRLEAFNGLQLLLTLDALPAIVITGFADPVLESQAKQLGAEYLVKPVSPSALLGLVEKKLKQQAEAVIFETPRRWMRKEVAGGLPAQVDASRARIFDVSYGGLRLELNEDPPAVPPSSFHVRVPAKDIAVQVDLVWQSRTREGNWQCGAALSPTDHATTSAWQGLVDTL